MHWLVCLSQIEKPVDSMSDEELLQSHIQHFKTVRKRCAFNHDCIFPVDYPEQKFRCMSLDNFNGFSVTD